MTLGGLSVKYTAQEAEYIGPKYYRLDDRWTIAGLKARHRKDGPGKWTQIGFTGINTICYDGIDGGLSQYPQLVDRSQELLQVGETYNGVLLPPYIREDI